MGLIYCAGGRAPHFPDPFRQIATAILLKRSKKWPCSPTLLATIAQVRQPPRPGFDLPRKGHSAPMDAVTGVAAGFVCARRQGKIRIRPGRGRSTEPPSLITESGDEALASRRFGRVRIAIPVAVLAATVAAGWHQVAAIDLLRVSETLHLVPTCASAGHTATGAAGDIGNEALRSADRTGVGNPARLVCLGSRCLDSEHLQQYAWSRRTDRFRAEIPAGWPGSPVAPAGRRSGCTAAFWGICRCFPLAAGAPGVYQHTRLAAGRWPLTPDP